MIFFMSTKDINLYYRNCINFIDYFVRKPVLFRTVPILKTKV